MRGTSAREEGGGIHIQAGTNIDGVINFGSITGGINNAQQPTPSGSTPSPGANVGTSVEARAPLVFLCHASEDKGSVRPYRDLLLSEGFATWLDEDDIIPGQSWDAAIRDAIRRAHAVIVFVSRHSSKEGYLQREITAVLDQAEHRPRDEIFLIPALLEDSPLPDRLRSYQWVALHEASGFHKLKAALDTLRPLPST